MRRRFCTREALAGFFVIAVAVAGCAFPAPGTRCDRDNPCPSGWHCYSGGFCYRGGATSDASMASESGIDHPFGRDAAVSDHARDVGTSDHVLDARAPDSAARDATTPIDSAAGFDGALDFDIGPFDSGGNLCPAATSFSDDFSNTTSSGQAWTPLIAGDCNAWFDGSSAQTIIYGGGVSDCRFVSSACFDLTSSSVTLEISPITTHNAAMHTFIGVAIGAELPIALTLTEDIFTFVVGSNGGTAPYSDVVNYWRLREYHGSVIFESSDNATNWTFLGSAPLDFPVTEVWPVFGIATDSATGSSIGVGFSKYNPVL